eukprot:3647863-Prymnesium_polylepis.1
MGKVPQPRLPALLEEGGGVLSNILRGHSCGCWTLYMWVPRVGTCRALQGYAILARGTDPRPNAPLPVG